MMNNNKWFVSGLLVLLVGQTCINMIASLVSLKNCNLAAAWQESCDDAVINVGS
jgi:hypothetical protein